MSLPDPVPGRSSQGWGSRIPDATYESPRRRPDWGHALFEWEQVWATTGASLPTPDEWDAARLGSHFAEAQRDRANRKAASLANASLAVGALCDYAERHGGSLWPYEIRAALYEADTPQSTPPEGVAPVPPIGRPSAASPTGTGCGSPGAGGTPRLNTDAVRAGWPSHRKISHLVIRRLCKVIDQLRADLDHRDDPLPDCDLAVVGAHLCAHCDREIWWRGPGSDEWLHAEDVTP